MDSWLPWLPWLPWVPADNPRNAFANLEADRNALKAEVELLRRQKAEAAVAGASNVAALDGKELQELQSKLQDTRQALWG